MTEQTAPRKLVYVVEDDPEQLLILRMLLNDAGFDVVTESDADRVIAGVRSLQPDIILLDVMLPSREGLDGFQLCQQLRADVDFKAIPVIMVSAIASGVGGMREKLLAQAGADDFFVKPYSPQALISRVRELCSA